jgi:hypothetical protein
MPWAATLKVTNCSSGAALPGAWITDGYVTYYTDAYGQFIAIIDDVWHTYIVNVGANQYITKTFSINRGQHEGRVTTVCLDPAPPSTGGGGTGGCFIVSATTGSALSAENMRLNMLRERVLASTELGASLLGAVYDDYYSFSPPIAAELAADDELRRQVLDVAVRPLLAWYGLVEAVVLDGDDRALVESAVKEVSAACESSAPAEVAALCAALARGEALPQDAPEPFGYLSSRLGDVVALPYSAWSMFDPLVRVWRCRAGEAELEEEVARWLIAAPLDRLPQPAPGERFEAELGLLAAGPFRTAAARAEVGLRLAAAWPELAGELRRHGFVGDRATG